VRAAKRCAGHGQNNRQTRRLNPFGSEISCVGMAEQKRFRQFDIVDIRVQEIGSFFAEQEGQCAKRHKQETDQNVNEDGIMTRHICVRHAKAVFQGTKRNTR